MGNRQSHSILGNCQSILFVLSLTMLSSKASAGDLNRVVTDLFGGEGIFVETMFHTAHFTVASFDELDNLNSLVTSQLNNVPVSSSNVGYSYDVTQGILVRRQNGMGPLLSERAWTVGKGILNVGYSYQRIDYDSLNGQSLDNLTLTAAHQDCCGGNPANPFTPPPNGILGVPSFELDLVNININLELEQQVHSVYATFGVTDNWDIGVLIPIIQVNARANAVATVVDVATNIHRFPGPGTTAIDSTGGSEWGVGDMRVRTKYTVIKEHETAPDFAVALDVIMPTGDEKNLLGTGYAQFRPTFIASKQFGMFTPHINAGYQVSTAPTRISESLDNLNYIVGFEAQILEELVTAFDFLGKWFPSQPNKDLSNLVDAGFQVRWNPIATTTFNGFVIIPVNGDSGLRSDAIWGLGLEHSF